MRQQRKRITPKERQHVYALCDGHCAYCGCEITIKQMQVDHYIPLELSAIATADGHDADSLDNMMPACRSCNNYKSWLTPERFREAIYRWHDVLMRDNVTYKNAVRFGQVRPTQHVPEFYFEKIGVTIPAMEWDADFRCMMQRMAKRSSERQEDDT